MSWILIVEDNAADVFLIREALQSHGVSHELRWVEDGEQAIRLIDKLAADKDETCPELVLLDLNLPRITGLEILKHLRESERCAGLPVLVLTSSDAPSDRTGAAHYGVRDYFRKPIDLEEFMALGGHVRKLLDLHTVSEDSGAHTQGQARRNQR